VKGFLEQIIMCPRCGAEGLTVARDAVTCSRCGSTYPVRDGVPYFLDVDRYWCNVPRQEMQAIVELVRENGFRDALQSHVAPYLHSAILPPGRADARFFLPLGPSSRVLDLGCMWGGLTVALADHCATIVGIDQTLETLQLARHRVEEEGRENVFFVGGDARRIPVRDNTFDLVIMNGVLEWLGVQDEYVVEAHWGKRAGADGGTSDATNPRRLQLEGLQEALRVLKPGGTLCVGIENRVRTGYFVGEPDDHTGVRYSSLLPRRLATLYTRLAIRQPYRAYTYTARGLRKLIRTAGFADQTWFTAFPTYERPRTILPLDSKLLRFCLEHVLSQEMGLRAQALDLIQRPTGLALKMVPAFIVTARKDLAPGQSEVGRTLGDVVAENWSTLFPGIPRPSATHLVKVKSRMEEGAPVAFLLFADDAKTEPLGFIKLNRDSSGIPGLKHEAREYTAIYSRCSRAREGLAAPLFAGHIDQYFMLSRTALRGDAIQDRDVTSLARNHTTRLRRRVVERVLARLYSVPGSRATSSGAPFADLAEKAVEWLTVFQNETAGRPIVFDEFWSRFADGALERARRLGAAPPLPTQFSASYRARLQELSEGLSLRLGPIHGDYNHHNVLIGDRGASVVDWEYAEEESFPPFDALNLFLQAAMDAGGLEEVENLFRPTAEGELASVTHALLARYAGSQGYTLEFVMACAPLFVLDLLQRDYGFHEFPLRSVDALERLLDCTSGPEAE
jgi:ubiquinone/menaquinone biosynthesis C-methylase UbiE/uncharacterized protein YbaR (Trm112 family)